MKNLVYGGYEIEGDDVVGLFIEDGNDNYVTVTKPYYEIHLFLQENYNDVYQFYKEKPPVGFRGGWQDFGFDYEEFYYNNDKDFYIKKYLLHEED